MLQNNGNNTGKTSDKKTLSTNASPAAKVSDKASVQSPAKSEKAGAKKQVSFAGNAPTVLAFAVFCLLLLTENMASASYVNSGNPYLSTMVLQLCIFVVPCAFYCTLRRVKVSSACRIRLPGVSGWTLVLCALPALVFAVMAAKYIQCYVFEARLGSAVSITSAGDSLYLVLSYAVVPAVAEELCFRGIMLSEYEKYFGKLVAIVTTSLLFAMIHFNARDFFAYLISGIIIGITVCATNSVAAGMILHFFSNLVAIFTDNFIVKISSDSSAGRFALVIVMVVSLAFVMLWLSRIEKLYNELSERAQKPSAAMTERERLLNTHSSFAGGERIRLLHPDISVPTAFRRIVVSPAFVCVCIAFLIKIATE